MNNNWAFSGYTPGRERPVNADIPVYNLSDVAIRKLAKTDKLPDWMNDPSLLPRKPPCRK